MTRSSGRHQKTSSRTVRASLGVALIAATTWLAAPAESVSGPPIVTLAFDNGSVTGYTLAYQQALQPHSARATFFVNSGTIGSSANFASWTQLSTLAAAGNDIGGKTVNATNLTTDPNPTAQVCNDRAALLAHQLTPAVFAYPGGTSNSTVQGVVKSCGYGNARSAGSLSPTGPTYAETLPPANWFSTRAYAPSTVTLANMQALVNGSAAHNGGWSQIVIGKVCSQTADAANYTNCSASAGHIELSDLNSFLDWVAAAGQTGGAPAGTLLRTTAAVASAADAAPPTTTITCNGAACQSTPYPGVVSIALAATDVGSSLASTRYTTDGSDPTTASTAYSGPFNVNGTSTSTTVKFRSWDYAGNAEATQTQVVQAPPDTAAPTTTIACNGTGCSTTAYTGSVSVSLAATDTGGSGLQTTYVTTDGSTPTTSSPVYTSPFPLGGPGTYSVKFFSTDKAGNAEAPQQQQIQVNAYRTAVALTFDDGTISQLTLGYTQALKPHNARATFFVNSGTIGSSANFASWTQLSTVAGTGNDIGGKTVNATNLTTDPNPTAQVCNDRVTLLAHGLTPVAFAYPSGTSNSTVQSVVKNCGYGNARSAGSMSPTGPTYAETLPPANWFSTRAYAPNTVTLANMQALVSGAASHNTSQNGVLTQIVIGKVCSQTADAANYTSCSASAGHIELSDLNAFLDWMAAAGQTGGAPAGAALLPVKDAILPSDATPPVSTITCDGAACPSGSVPNVVRATLSATDVGSSVASIHYTTDGSDPSPASPAFTAPIPITHTVTVKYRAYDYAGNVEAINTQVIQAAPPPDTTAPTTTISCNGAACATTGYNGPVSVAFAASDTGWGVDKTYYTTDGTTPTTASPAFTAAFTLAPGSYSVQFFSVDLAGNAEPTQSQQLLVLPPQVVVSLTFDDTVQSQYTLGFLKALKPHHMNATFYSPSGLTEVDSQHMLWPQVTAINNSGNEIAGHTMHHVNLKTATDDNVKMHEVCDDRQNLIAHGFDPFSFAYPEGAWDATAQNIVRNCGYGTARAAGGINTAGIGAGPVYSETLPPRDLYATRTMYDSQTGNGVPISLTRIQDAVTAAAVHGGGWTPFVFHQVCSQQYEPAEYAGCIADYGPVELDTLNQFLDWLQKAGQPGGAPARTVVQTVRQTIAGPDLQAPTTIFRCDGSPCQTTTYLGSTTLTPYATDPGGSGVRESHYTTDGSAPTMASPVFTAPFTINAPLLLRFFSVDNSGNVEQPQSLQLTVQPNPDPIIGSAGDIACDPLSPAFYSGQGTDTDCRAIHTVGLLKGVDAVLPLGDNQYDCGGMAAFQASYGPTWGVKNSIAHPVPGDADIGTTGTDCPTPPGAAYYQYFGASAGDPAKGYYSYDLGQWHLIAINTAPCVADPTTCQAGSPQDLWLQQDLAAHASTQCTLAYYQTPRWASSGSGSGGDPIFQQIWQDLYAGGTDVVLNGDSHWYERTKTISATGTPDASYGIREFIVGTGGQGLDTPGPQQPNTDALNASTHGVIRMTLKAGSYTWGFVPDEGTFTDSGTGTCHGVPPTGADNTAPTTTVTCNGAPCTTAYAPSNVAVAMTATDNPGGRGVASTHYTTDGTVPTLTSPAYTTPITVTANTTFRYQSWDNAGNVEATKTLLVQFDSSPPATTITCNGSACGSYYSANVTVGLAATDVGPAGVASTTYTTDGTDPVTSATAKTYSTPFTLTSTAVVKYFSRDKVGNTEPTKSQLVSRDNTGPTTTATCNGAACSGVYNANVTFALTAIDSGPSGVKSTYYTTNGSNPTTASAVYTAPLTITATTTVKYFSSDNAGNNEAAKTTVVTIDKTAPTTTIRCNNAACSTTSYKQGPTVTLIAVDTGGAGFQRTVYTTDGTDPATSGTATTYSGGFVVGRTTTVQYLSYDNAGNREATKSQTITVDSARPAAAITSPPSGSSARRGSTVALAATATDAGSNGDPASGVNNVTFYYDGGNTIGTDTTAPSTAITVIVT